MLQRRRFYLALIVPLVASGCGPLFGTPQIWPPAPESVQINRAKKFDPFPDPSIGPPVIGGRPQGFLDPRPDPDPNKTECRRLVQSAGRGRLSAAGLLSGPRHCVSAAGSDDLHVPLNRSGRSSGECFSHIAKGRLSSHSSVKRTSGCHRNRADGANGCANCLRQENRCPLTAHSRASYDKRAALKSLLRQFALEIRLGSTCRKLASSKIAVGALAGPRRNRDRLRAVQNHAGRWIKNRPQNRARCGCRKCWPPRASAAGGSARKSSARGASMSAVKPLRNSARAVDPFQHQIRVDGEVVSRPKRRLYFLINKPVGIISTNQDPSGRPRVIDLPRQPRTAVHRWAPRQIERRVNSGHERRPTDRFAHPSALRS